MSLTSTGNFQQLCGGLHAAVVPFERTKTTDRALLMGVLRDAIEYEAKVHDAEFNRAGFTDVMRALAGDEIKAAFYFAGWETCQPTCLGAQVYTPSLSVTRNGRDLRVERGIYTEDVVIPPNKIRSLVADKPAGKFFPPDTGLGAHFDLESLRLMAGHHSAMGRIGEVAPSNTRMRRILDGHGAVLGEEQNSAVLELTGGIPDSLKSTWKPAVEIKSHHLDNGAVDPNNFYVRWASADGNQQIIAAYTRTISTFTGKPVVRAQIVSNGNAPDKSVLTGVLAGLMEAGEQEIRDRMWGLSKSSIKRACPSPSIPILGTSQEQFSALVQAASHQTGAPARSGTTEFGGPLPTTYFHVLNEPEILEVLTGHGIQRRVLGHHAMQPGTLDFRKTAKRVEGFILQQQKPLTLAA